MMTFWILMMIGPESFWILVTIHLFLCHRNMLICYCIVYVYILLVCGRSYFIRETLELVNETGH